MLVDRKNTSKLIQSWNVVVWCCFQIDNLVMGIGYATNAQDAHFMLDSCSYIFEYFVACQTNIFSFQYKHKSSIKYVLSALISYLHNAHPPIAYYITPLYTWTRIAYFHTVELCSSIHSFDSVQICSISMLL